MINFNKPKITSPKGFSPVPYKIKVFNSCAYHMPLRKRPIEMPKDATITRIVMSQCTQEVNKRKCFTMSKTP